MARSKSRRNGSASWENAESQTYVSYADSSYGLVDGSFTQTSNVKKRKRHRGLPVVTFLLTLLIGLAGVSAAVGLTLLNQAKEVKAQAKEVVELVEGVPDAIMAGDTAGLPMTANRVADLANEINTTVNQPLWNLATALPVVGSDIKIVQTLGGTLTDLANNALMPIANNLQGLELSDLFSNKRVNVDKLTLLANAVTIASPAIERAVATMDSLPEARLSQVREYVEKAQAPISKIGGILEDAGGFLSIIPQVFGAGGSRTYLLIAQNNAELRSDGGLPGSVGFVTITDGYIQIGDFESISHKYTSNRYVSETEEEYKFFSGVNLYNDFAQITFLPEFERVGQLTVDFCEFYWPGVKIDGVMAIDPTFLQKLMAITGSSTQVAGVTLDGNTTAEVLTHSVYELFGESNTNDYTDKFFAAAADACADAVFANLGNIGLKDVKELLTETANSGHFYLWMADEVEQAAVRAFAFSGNLDYDRAEPQLGVYLNDYTQSKIDWYVGCATYVGEGYTNADGSTTYEVTTYVKNYLTSDDADSLPKYIIGGAYDNKYCNSDAITRLYLFAPYGGTITDVKLSYEGPIEFDNMYTYMGSGTVWGHQGHTMQFHTPAQGVITITYKVTTTAEAIEPLTVRQTPMAQEGYGTVNYAWEQ